jgi:hypothetical protein
MLDQLRKSTRSPSPKLMRRLIEAEQAAGLAPPALSFPKETVPEEKQSDYEKINKLLMKQSVEIASLRQEIVELRKALSPLKR